MMPKETQFEVFFDMLSFFVTLVSNTMPGRSKGKLSNICRLNRVVFHERYRAISKAEYPEKLSNG